MLNGYYDISLGKGAELYLLGGVGGAQVTFREFGFAEDDPQTGDQVALAWQAGAGLSFPVGNKVNLDLRYRYFATTPFSFDDHAVGNIYHRFNENGRLDISRHSVLLGLRVNI
jgi:opacity protein-like surface antigen